jgi:hypothetical protein
MSKDKNQTAETLSNIHRAEAFDHYEMIVLQGLKDSKITSIPAEDVRRQLTRAIDLLTLEVPDLDGHSTDHHMFLVLTFLREGFDKADNLQRAWRTVV